MAKEHKYIINMGLAFDEDRAMRKLSDMAKEGWVLEEMTLFRYKLVKHDPANLVYTMDYKKMDNDESEYFDLFEDSGWKHMSSYGGFHFFAGSPGVVPIYTDKKSYLEKYKSYKQGCVKSVLVSIFIIMLTFIFKALLGPIEGTFIRYILKFIYAISVIILIPSVMMLIAYSIREKKLFRK